VISSVKKIGIGLLIAAGLAIAVFIAWNIGAYFGNANQVKSVVTIGRPIIMRTPGGLLEVASLNINERLELVDPKKMFGLNLGETISQIDVPSTYRYHIELKPEWKMEIRGKTCFVISPLIKASLPVAIDTEQMQKRTKSGWARFNKKKNLANLEKSISSMLEEKASSDGNMQLVLEPARKTVSEFVSKWLIKEQQWGLDPEHQVKVTFADESPIN